MSPPRLLFSGRDFDIVFVRAGMPPNAVDVSQGSLQAYRLPKAPVMSLRFADLWENYPFGQPYPDPNGLLDGNQCAVKMSVALSAAGVPLGGFPGASVILSEPQGPIRAAIRANELADWLKQLRISGLSKPEDVTGMDWRTKIARRQGIVYFVGFWPRTDAEKADPKLYSGDHIDLWNGTRLEISSDDAPAQIARSLGWNQGLTQFTFGWHNLNNSKQILFWQVQ
jgi:hypothetical protein